MPHGAPTLSLLPPENLTVATTGASGSLFLMHFLRTVERDPRVKTVNFIVSDSGLRLIERAADVTLKERRPLVLCIRETPLNKIHIRNMSLAADAGATIFPLIPTFYNHPSGLDAMAQEFANRVLAHIGLPQQNAYRWKD